MTTASWPTSWPIKLDNQRIDLPMAVKEGLRIYSFDSMGDISCCKAAAKSLHAKIRASEVEFDIVVTTEAKAIPIAERLVELLGHREYVVLRKATKAYMIKPVRVSVKSISTNHVQTLYLGQEKFPLLRGKKVLALDDVNSTWGTARAVTKMSRKVGFEIVAYSSVLVEGAQRKVWNKKPVICVDYIPLPEGEFTSRWQNDLQRRQTEYPITS